jgi:hypothetical protein
MVLLQIITATKLKEVFQRDHISGLKVGQEPNLIGYDRIDLHLP